MRFPRQLPGILACSSLITMESLTMLANSVTLHSDDSANKISNLVRYGAKGESIVWTQGDYMVYNLVYIQKTFIL
jgi:hypothetical protein